MKKSTSQKIHAVKRHKERYGFSISESDYNAIVNLVKLGNSKFLFSQSNRTSFRTVSFNSKQYFIVYDKIRKTIVTFLTEEMVKETQKKYLVLGRGKKVITPNQEISKIVCWDQNKKIATTETLLTKKIEHYRFNELKPYLEQEEKEVSKEIPFQPSSFEEGDKINTPYGEGFIITKNTKRPRYLVKTVSRGALWVNASKIERIVEENHNGRIY